MYIQCLVSGLKCPDLSPRQDASCIYWLPQFTCSITAKHSAEIDGFLCLVKLPAYCPSGLSAGCLTVLPLCLCNPFKELFLQRSRQCFSESECKGRGFRVNHQTLQEKNWRKTQCFRVYLQKSTKKRDTHYNIYTCVKPFQRSLASPCNVRDRGTALRRDRARGRKAGQREFGGRHQMYY